MNPVSLLQAKSQACPALLRVHAQCSRVPKAILKMNWTEIINIDNVLKKITLKKNHLQAPAPPSDRVGVTVVRVGAAGAWTLPLNRFTAERSRSTMTIYGWIRLHRAFRMLCGEREVLEVPMLSLRYVRAETLESPINSKQVTRAKTIFPPPFSFDEFQEYLCKDGLIAKTRRAVQTL